MMKGTRANAGVPFIVSSCGVQQVVMLNMATANVAVTKA